MTPALEPRYWRAPGSWQAGAIEPLVFDDEDFPEEGDDALAALQEPTP